MLRKPTHLLFIGFIVTASSIFVHNSDEKDRLEPTEIQNESSGSDDGREAWFERIHKAAPGTDWRQIEAENRRRHLAAYPASAGSRNLQETFANGFLRGEWLERGSGNQAGSVGPTDLDVSTGSVYAISAGKTLWKGNIAGYGWQPINDKMQFGWGMLKYIPNTGTGRLLVELNHAPAYSDDQGMSWISATGLPSYQDSTKVIQYLVSGDATHTIYLLLHEHNPVGTSFETSIYRSTNQGTSFSKVYQLPNDDYATTSMWAKPDGSAVYCLVNSKDVYRCTSPSGNFSLIHSSTTMPMGKSNLAGFANSGSIQLYAMNTQQQVFRSTDEGASWTYMSTAPVGSRCGLTASLVNAGYLFIGDVEAYRSYDAGASWQKVNDWWNYYNDPSAYLHADIMSIRPFVNSAGNEMIVIGTHGGLYSSTDELTTVYNIGQTGLRTNQYYAVLTNRDNTNFVYTGSQDQGWQRTNIDNGSIEPVEQVMSGDFGHLSSGDRGQSLWLVYPGMVAYFTDAVGGNSALEWNFNNTQSVWMPPLVADPAMPNRAYLGGGHINGTGEHLIQLVYTGSASLAATELPFDFMAASNGGHISAVAISPIDQDNFYVLTDNGMFFRSIDHGQTWQATPGFNSGPGPYYFYGAKIYASKSQSGVVWIAGSGYSNPGVYCSMDNGETFQARINGLPSTMVYGLDGNSNDQQIFAATEAGPFMWSEVNAQWYDIAGNGAPMQTYWDVEYVAEVAAVRFATFGRGIWDFHRSDVFPLANHNTPKEIDNLQVYPNPVNHTLFFGVPSQLPNGGQAVVWDANGKPVASTSLSAGQLIGEVNIDGLPSGQYILRLSSGSIVWVGKFIK